MKGLKYTILPHGTIENDLAWNIAMPNPATKHNQKPEASWIQAPSYSVLVSHPDIGYLLFDTGSYLGDEAERRPESMQEIFPLYIKREEYLDACLNQLHVSVEEINVVLLSHMHWDHSGGLGFFQKKSSVQKVITAREDYAYGITETLAPWKPDDNCPYMKDNYQFTNLDYILIDEDQELCEGIELILLPGHTPAVMGMILHLENRSVIFPSDAINNQANYGPNAKSPGIIYDTIGFRKAVKKVMQLQKKYDAEVIFPHDYNQFKQLKKAPYYYE